MAVAGLGFVQKSILAHEVYFKVNQLSIKMKKGNLGQNQVFVLLHGYMSTFNLLFNLDNRIQIQRDRILYPTDHLDPDSIEGRTGKKITEVLEWVFAVKLKDKEIGMRTAE